MFYKQHFDVDNFTELLNHNMQITTPKSQQIYSWLLDRGLSPEVIETSGLDWNGREIVIPVFDKEKNFLFNKYRRDPFETDDTIPKYRYEVGSTATLFNAHTVAGKHGEIIFICEGELDCLLLNSLGMNAVSSTGGSGTFRPEWFLDFCNNEIYIVYDRDDAGVKGALRINTMMASAKIIFLPADTKGKDVTDYFKTHSVKQLSELALASSSWVMPMDIKEVPSKKLGVTAIIKNYKNLSNELLERQREENSKGNSIRHIEMMQELIEKRIESWKKIEQNFNKKFNDNGDDIARAKSTPITNYIKFDGNGFALCLWHNEKHGSMKYRPERNKVFCHGCGAHKDVLDVVMEQRGISFNEAIKFVLNK